MSSIILGFNYDIFISYRQKDNRGERWVSEFVDASLMDKLKCLVFFPIISRTYCYPKSFAEADPFHENIRGEERFKKLMERVKYEWENFEV